tara:strand:+ start:282 stop:803 length:522 start_codon:yes stop_codon:yes gene_type:complete
MLSIPYQSKVRAIDLFPQEEEDLGRSLYRHYQLQLLQGEALAPLFILIQTELVETVSLMGIRGWVGDHHRVLSSLVGGRELEFAALVLPYALQKRTPNTPKQAALEGLLVFLEQPNNCWWVGWRSKETLLEPPMVLRAVDQNSKPPSLGGWFSRSRRERLRIEHLISDDVTIH